MYSRGQQSNPALQQHHFAGTTAHNPQHHTAAYGPSRGSSTSWAQQGQENQHWNERRPPPQLAAATGADAGFNYGFGAGRTPTDQAGARVPPFLNHHQPASYPAAPASSFHAANLGAGDVYQAADQDSLKSVKDLPAPLQPVFNFRYFNPVQSECFDTAYTTDINMVVSAPTGAGKTGVMELAITRLLSKHLLPASGGPAQQGVGPAPTGPQQLQPLNGSMKTIYLGPIKALVQERQADWHSRFGQLGLNVVSLTGDDDSEHLDDLEAADIICSTPEKFDQITRKVAEKGSMGFFAEIALVLLDEVHLLNEAGRGSSLEAGCVCRIKAVAAFPEMAKAPVAAVRFVAVSATIPNIQDIARWLSVPPSGLRQYGDELRPCKLTTHVKGYSPAKNDFLFERRLNDHVYNIVSEYSKGRPALVFCSSRKGTTEAAAALVKEAEAQAQVAAHTAGASRMTGSTFVRDMQQLQRLRAAAAGTQAKALASVLVAGVGFHNAAMEPADRELVETLFKANDLAVLCTTSTLAMGVNLPAHLVVLKGTVRWVGDSEVSPGEQPGYKEYSQTEVLQMVGRAGRPQFDTEGIAVIMTSRDSSSRYQKLLSGQVVESCLLSTLPEHLMAEVVLGTVKDMSQAIAWIRSTFLFTRVRANPQHYGLKLKPGTSEAELDVLLRDEIALQPMKELMKYQLLESDEDSYSLTATPAGKLMVAHFLKLKTMAAIVQLGERPNVPSLLRVICGADEFKCTSLRRSEKKLLNEINHSKDTEQLRYHVMASKDGNKIKERISLPAEKLFILLNDALSDKPSEALDYSLKQEQSRLLLVGQRIAKCMAKHYALRGSFSCAGRSLLLARSLKARLWEDSRCSVRQLPSVGRLLGARLAAAGLGSLQAIDACGDAHRLEVAAQKPYPWGSELLASLRSSLPPPTEVSLQVLEPLPGGRGYSCQATLTPRLVAATAGPGRSGSSNSPTPHKLLVGCSSTDELLLLRSVVLEKMDAPVQIKFKVAVPAGVNQPLNVTAMLLHERLIGLDQKASMLLQPLVQQQPFRGPARSSSRQQQPTTWTAPAGSNAYGPDGSDSAAHGVDMSDDELEQCGNGEDQQAGSGDAAAEAYAVLQRKQQRNAKRSRRAEAVAAAADGSDSVAGVSRHPVSAEEGADEGAAATLASAKRSRVDHQMRMQQLQQQEQQQDTGMQPEALQQSRQSTAPAPHTQMPLQSSIAARYRSMFSLGASSLQAGGAAAAAPPAAQLRDPTSSAVPGRGTESVAAAAPGAAARASVPALVPSLGSLAAMDAGALQVTPVVFDKTPKSGPESAAPSATTTAAGSHGLQQPAAAEAQQQQQQQQQLPVGSGMATAVCPVRDVGQAMSSLFDMLADDDDADQEGEQAALQQQVQQRRPQGQEEAQLQHPAAIRQTQQLLTAAVQQHCQMLASKRPAAGMHMGASSAAAHPSMPPDKASAAAVFGAAVQRSHRTLNGLVPGCLGDSSAGSLQPPLPAGSMPPGAGMRQRQLESSAGAASVWGLQQQQQQPPHRGPLLTPPHQVKPAFSGSAAAAASGSRSGHRSSSALSAWQGVGAARRDKQPQGATGRPDFSAFAFTAGPSASRAAQPAGWGPAAKHNSSQSSAFTHMQQVLHGMDQGQHSMAPGPASKWGELAGNSSRTVEAASRSWQQFVSQPGAARSSSSSSNPAAIAGSLQQPGAVSETVLPQQQQQPAKQARVKWSLGQQSVLGSSRAMSFGAHSLQQNAACPPTSLLAPTAAAADDLGLLPALEPESLVDPEQVLDVGDIFAFMR